MTSQAPAVKVGQVWQDWDIRQRRAQPPRYGEVRVVTDTHCEIKWQLGNRTRVKLSRMRPTSTGYMLVKDVE